MRILAEKIFNFLTAFFGCWAIQLTTGITVRNPLTVVLFVSIYMLSGFLRSFAYKGDKKWIPAAAAVFLSAAIGAVLSKLIYPYASKEFTNSLFRLLTFVILCVGYFFLLLLLFSLIHFLIKRGSYEKINLSKAEKEAELRLFIRSLPDKRGQNTLVFITAGITFLFYLPYFLYEYPGIMTADSLVQYQQIIGVMDYSNHHPVVHTLLIKFFYEIGMILTGDPIRSIAFYTVFQMLLMSICHGMVVKEVSKVLGHIDLRVMAGCLAFFALFPVNAVFAVTLWKDVPFAGISELLSCLLVDMYRRRDEGFKGSDLCILAVLIALFSLMRSNAFYSFLAFIPFMLIVFRSRIKEIALPVILSLVLVFLIKGPVFNMFLVTPPDFVESLSLPLQQVGRLLVMDRKIEEGDLAAIDEVIDRTYIRELYVPGYADNIKELVRAGHPEVLEAKKPEYLGIYIKYALKYPLDYVKAWYDLVGGYIYPDVFYRVGDVDGIMDNDYGLYPEPIIGGKFIKVKEILLKLGDFMPLYGMLFSAGAYTWCLVGIFIIVLKRRRFILVHVLMLLLVMTLLIASPVVDFRYEYAVVLTAPLWAAIGLGKAKE